MSAATLSTTRWSPPSAPSAALVAALDSGARSHYQYYQCAGVTLSSESVYGAIIRGDEVVTA